MRLKQLTVVVLVFMLIISALFTTNLSGTIKAQITPDVYVGIDVAHVDLEAIDKLIDEVSSYTNLFVIGCKAISHNVTRLDSTCQKLYDRGFSFIVYQEWPIGINQRNWRDRTVSNWTETAKNRWGNQFLGIHYLDEPGGKQLDREPGWIVINNPVNGEDAANQYYINVSRSVNWFRSGYSDGANLSLFVSDYALYWFDYEAGYDTVFAEFGWNYSRQLNVALCRGAATAQNKDWGAIITWTYTHDPYIESGLELYRDLIFAYDNGAKYIIVFDTNEDYTQSILQEEHLDALKQFWLYIHNNPRNSHPVEERTALVLPEGYAYGFRGPDDKIWGEWYANDFAYHLSVDVNSLLEQYGTKLDIIYDDSLQEGETHGYGKLIWWNNTSIMPSLSPTTEPSPSHTPPSSLTPTDTPDLPPTPSPTALPSQLPSNLTPTHKPTPIQNPQNGQNTYTGYEYAAAAGGAILIAAVITMILRRRRII